MNTRIAFIMALLLGAGAPSALAQGAQPILSVSMTEIDVFNNPGPPTNPQYFAIYGNNPIYGTGSPGSPVNGGNGPYTDAINMWALATGTFPASGFTYTFYVNGAVIGNAINMPTMFTPPQTNNDQYPQVIGWSPPQPGVYYLSCTCSDGLGHTANSLAVEYFATGISIVSPETNSLVPLGSSVVIQAAAAVASGAISKVSFFVDGGPTTGVLLGTAVNYPYSIIYTPDDPTGFGQVHFITAVSYLADGSVASISSGPNSVVVVAPVLPLPTCIINTPAGTPASPSTVAIPDYAADSAASIPIVIEASGPNNITQVQLYVNGVLYGTLASVPYTFNWQPTVTGLYSLTALAYDSKNNVIASTTSTASTLTPAPTTVNLVALPAVAITSPANGSTLNGGGPATMSVSAATASRKPDGTTVGITQVQFFQDGNLVGTAIQPDTPGGNIYTISWTAVQKLDPTTGLPVESVLTAIATDGLGFSATSAAIEVQVTSGGSGGGTIVGTPPTVSITNPTSMENVVVNTPVTLMATGTAPNGNIAQIEFLVDNHVLSSATQYPYSVVWTPMNLGTYTVTAQVTDNLGDKIDSQTVTVVVVPEPPPSVNISSPTSGGIVTAGSGTTISANAVSPSGTIAQVQFYANGILVGTSTVPPYSITWTPQSSGVYTLTAVTTDNSGESTTSSPSIVEAVVSNGGLGNTIYFGQYQGLTDGGRFAFAVVDGTTGAYIGHSTGTTTPSVGFYPDLAVGSGGAFSNPSLSGSASVTGVTGSLTPSKDEFIGTVTQSGANSVAAGYYTGSISGQPTSQVSAIVGYDGEIMVYVNQGTFSDAGDSTVDSGGNFTIVTPSNNTITGKVDPSTGFFSATLTGGQGGLLLAGRISGGTFSDGVLKNLSTRGLVGSGGDSMIAGFVVGGTTAKQLLVRAVGPTLSTLGVPGAIAGVQFSIYSGTTAVASNAGWSTDPTNAAQVNAAELASGAFALPTGSADSALVSSFSPGNYTVVLSGTGSDTGVGLVEVYDLDALQPFTAQKLINVSTRGSVGTGANILIGGFSIDGAAPKRLLIRAAGPGLASMGVTGSLAAPRLQLFNVSGQIIRENFAWQSGNDVSLTEAAEAQTGAFAFASGSADSAILIVLPPGNYTAEVSGTNATTGIALVEVYEIP